MKTPQKGDNDRHEPIAGIEIDADLAGRTGRLEQSRQSGQYAGCSQAEQNQAGRIGAGKTRRFRGLPADPDLKAKHVSAEQNIGENHRNEGGNDAQMHAGAGNQFRIIGSREIAEAAAARKALPFRISQQAKRH